MGRFVKVCRRFGAGFRNGLQLLIDAPLRDGMLMAMRQTLAGYGFWFYGYFYPAAQSAF
jgi:hypothetical protein